MLAARWAATLAAIAVPLATVTAGGASAAAGPDPCTILATTVVSTTVGVDASMMGKVSTRPDGGVKQTLCTFTHNGATLEISIAPHQRSGGYGGPPGMVVTHPSGLGTGAIFAYGTNPKYLFANASFTKGAFDGGVWDNGKLPNGDVLALARLVYKALP